ncbi:unnamed protein product [Bursaphelenchus okinawaensis]|uniref:TPR_REGION domain-containing protein n=1 Tax=Bursaphelenchus okinawaensis TaxID=465554 RepID=A0A811LIM2_9BILA|nr:unnamed protein product [Bursaphelenchus okinawaensis]CAG9124064.1 unnamed protein product [Bursaphelenchus okinawaensis]
MQENQAALEFFDRVRKIDPYRIDQMNLYSNALFIRDEELKLTELADFFDTSHRFTWENCIILANYYSIRKMHDKAIEFLRRAIRLRPEDSQTFILLGQELLQTKDHQAATLAYRQAIALDQKSFRAWYCLGQLYEILKLPAYALYYYQQAVRCKPTDSRMLIATGVMLVSLKRYEDAEKCFKKAFQIGDVEGNALTELGSLYQLIKRYDQAARAYEYFLKLYCDETKDVSYGDEDTIASVCKFLSEYYFKRDELQKAYEYSHRCLHFDKTKEHAAQMLRNLKIERAKEPEKEPERAPVDMSMSINSMMQSFVHQSTPAAAHTSRVHVFNDTISLDQTINNRPTSQQQAQEEDNADEVSMEDADESEQVSF